MAPTLKRKRAQVSYRESSPEDDDVSGPEEMSEVSASSDEELSRPRRSSRKPPKITPQTPAKPTRRAQALRRPGRSQISYREPDSDVDTDVDFTPIDISPAQEHRTKRSKPSPQKHSPRKPSLRNAIVRPTRSSKSKIKKTRPLGARLPINEKSQEKLVKTILSDGVIPLWSQLPYHILLQIFVYASHPIQENTAWLLNTARLNRSFLEPALTALYRCPPVTTLTKSQHVKLLTTLLEPSSGRLYNYNVKVQRLELNSTSMMNYTSPQGGIFELSGLVSSLPQLSELEIFDPGDKPPYRRRHSIRWHYPDAVFMAMQRNEIRLRSWRWNALLLWTNHTPAWMGALHQTTPFQSVSHVSFSNFVADNPPKATEEDSEPEPSYSEALASALCVLPRLRGVTFESCGLILGPFLSLLPKNLSSLNLTNCIELTAETLQIFLETHGSKLTELTLNHNQSLDLSFLRSLKRTCPVLESLSMDLNYYSTFTTSNDADPKYEVLLTAEDIPTWPSTLQDLEMIYLRKWTTEAAETFLQSIIDSAADLPDLRTLILKATGILDISWRDRARLRDEWVARMQRVFLARPKPPFPHLVSLRAFREWKEQGDECKSRDSQMAPETPRRLSETRKFSHVQVTPGGKEHKQTVSESDGDDDSDAPLAPRLRTQNSTKRSLRPRTAGSMAESLTESSGSDDDDEGQHSATETFIQGLCTVVDIVIDNIRPREEIFHEEDFLDAEASGDEDWNENSPNEFDQSGYAW